MSTALPDVNVLVAATNPDHLHHKIAIAWLTSCTSYATTPITESGLVRCLMNPRITARPADYRAVIQILNNIKSSNRATFWPDVSPLSPVNIVFTGKVGYRQVTDMHLVNLAAHYSGKSITLDRGILGSTHPKDQHLIHVLS